MAIFLKKIPNSTKNWFFRIQIRMTSAVGLSYLWFAVFISLLRMQYFYGFPRFMLIFNGFRH